MIVQSTKPQERTQPTIAGEMRVSASFSCPQKLEDPLCDLCEFSDQKCSKSHKPPFILSRVTNNYSDGNKTIGIYEYYQPFNAGLNSSAFEYEIQVPTISNMSFSVVKAVDGTQLKKNLRKEQFDILIKYLDFSIQDLLRVKKELLEVFENWH